MMGSMKRIGIIGTGQIGGYHLNEWAEIEEIETSESTAVEV